MFLTLIEGGYWVQVITSSSTIAAVSIGVLQTNYRQLGERLCCGDCCASLRSTGDLKMLVELNSPKVGWMSLMMFENKYQMLKP